MTALNQKTAHRLGRRKQLGNGLLYAMLGMAVVSMVLAAYANRSQDQNVMSDGSAEGGIANTITAAAGTYISEQYGQLQPAPAQAVTKNGFTLGAGSVLNPTVANLNSLGYLTNTNGVGSFTNGNYVIQIQRTPAGCVGAACDLSGLVYIDTPVRRNAANEINGNWISGWLKATGANGGYSTPGNRTVITGPGWTATNPVAGQPAGVVALRFGFGSSGLGQFAKLTESRPVNFQNTFQVGGTATVAGAMTVNNDASVTGTATAGNFVTTGTSTAGKVQINDVVAVNTACPKNGLMAQDGSGQALTCQDGVWKLQGDGKCVANYSDLNFLEDDGRCYNGAGNPNSPAGGEWIFVEVYRHVNPSNYYVFQRVMGMTGAAVGKVWTRNQQSGTAGVGWGPWRLTAATAAAGDACGSTGSMATGTGDVALFCLNGIYVPLTSLYEVGQVGSACTTEGKQGYDSSASYTQLICRRNPSYTGAPLLWYRLQDLTGFKEFVGGGTYTHGTVVSKPACAAVGNSPRVAIIDFEGAGAAGSSDSSFNERAIDNGGSWTISLTNGSGAPLTSNAGFATKQVNIYCYTY